MNTRVVGRLKHDASLGSIHFIDAERTVVDLVALLPHSVHHEERLVRLLSVQPKNIINTIYLHSVHLLGRRMALNRAEIVVLVAKSVS